MSADRRSFLLAAPASLLGLAGLDEIAEFASAQTSPSTEVNHSVADFWVQRMGVPAKLVSGGSARPRQVATPVESGNPPGALLGGASISQHGGGEPGAIIHSDDPAGYGREPLFLHLDEDEQTLIPAEEVPKQKMHPGGDMLVELSMQRLRLSPGDQNQFERFTSGGIYLDVQQHAPQVQHAAEDPSQLPMALASSIFSAIFSIAGSSKGKKGKTAPAPARPGQPAPSSNTQSSVPLQQTAQAQSIALPGGIGKMAFSCFMKDPRKSAFGAFVSAFLQMNGSSSQLAYLPMLALPVVAGPALTGIRAMVGNLQAHGLDHAWILQCAPVDVASTVEGCSNLPNGLRLRTGTYIAVPKEHSGLLRNRLAGVKLKDGFVVPKSASAIDTYETSSETLPGVTYLSLSVKLKPTKLNGCLYPA